MCLQPKLRTCLRLLEVSAQTLSLMSGIGWKLIHLGVKSIRTAARATNSRCPWTKKSYHVTSLKCASKWLLSQLVLNSTQKKSTNLTFPKEIWTSLQACLWHLTTVCSDIKYSKQNCMEHRIFYIQYF